MSTRALMANGDGTPARVEVIQLTQPGSGQVLVEIAASAVCSTERMVIDRRLAGHLPDGVPRVLGHAGAGRVTAVGPGVGRVTVGQVVVITGTRQCGRCFFCLNGAPGACDEIFTQMERRVGSTADGQVVRTDGGMGTHADRMVFAESNLVPVSGAVEWSSLALLGCGIPSGVGAAVDVAETRPGNSVAISGLGHVGLWMLQGAQLAGASTIIAIDPRPDRRAFALDLGAHHALEPGEGLIEQVRGLTEGHGADVGLEAAGTTLAMRQSFDLTRYGGTVVPTGLESETAEVTLSNLLYSLGSRTVRGSQCGGGDVLHLVPRLESQLEAGRLLTEPIITDQLPLEEAGGAHGLLRSSRTLTTVIRTSSWAPDAPAVPRANVEHSQKGNS